MDFAELRIDSERMQQYFLDMAKIGATAHGGVNRVALTDEDKIGRDLFVKWLEELGLAVRYDDLGNIYGRYSGEEPDLPPLLLGSHLDTVYMGGKFDGTLGVIAGLEVLHRLRQAGVKTRYPIELVAFSNEEGVRFQPAMLSSGVVAGAFSQEYAYSRQDASGKTFGDELERIGYKGSIEHRPGQLHSYLELHIEQGTVLEEQNLPLGVVEAIQGQIWLQVNVKGQADHAGSTQMHQRKDALVAAATIIKGVRNIAGIIGQGMVTTVGRLLVEPNNVNAIPGKVTLFVDMRNPRDELVDEARDLVGQIIEQACQEEGVSYEMQELWRTHTTPFDPAVVDAVEAAARNLGYGYQRMISGAGHDAKYMADLCPTGMVFVSTVDGKSHCEEESAIWADVEKATNVLLQATLALAEPIPLLAPLAV